MIRERNIRIYKFPRKMKKWLQSHSRHAPVTNAQRRMSNRLARYYIMCVRLELESITYTRMDPLKYGSF